jgi:Icc-related predicted phosphoesterase
MIRIAAVGDVHVDKDVVGRYRPALERLPEVADVLLIAGDLTRHGTVEEARCFTTEFGGLDVPVVVVLGNHDHQSDQQDAVADLLTDSGIAVLEGSGMVLDLHGHRLGVAGAKGFGGGFAGACASEFGEPEMKAFVRHSRHLAAGLEQALHGLEADARVALTHYAPVADTLAGEPPEIHPFLGSYFLAEAIDGAGADLAVHGHAHAGQECGVTPGGTEVRNVALPVLRRAYALYALGAGGGALAEEADARRTAASTSSHRR